MGLLPSFFRPRDRPQVLVDAKWPPNKAPQEPRSPVMMDRTMKRCLELWPRSPVHCCPHGKDVYSGGARIPPASKLIKLKQQELQIAKFGHSQWRGVVYGQAAVSEQCGFASSFSQCLGVAVEKIVMINVA